MKTYNIEYEIDQEVYVNVFKSILFGTIQGINIDDRKYNKDNRKIIIQYYVNFHNGNHSSFMNSYSPSDIALTKEELIEKLKQN
jgi:hypothetical protein